MSRVFFSLCLLPFLAFALEIQRDFQDSFIFTDKVLSFDSQPCKNETEAPATPFRTYIIAIPNSASPNVQLENLKSETLKNAPCGADKALRSMIISEPYLKDNLWRVKINIPIVYSSGNAWVLRRDFRIKINFNGGASGYSVGKRALASVENKAGARQFGTKQAITPPRALRKDEAGIDWLVRIGIGNTDLSVNADGMYAVSFDDLRRIAGSEIDGIRISELRLFGASPDTLPESMGNDFSPNAVEIPILVKDKNNNGTFDNGDSIIFFGYGTKLWKKSGSANGMDYYFSHSPYSFYQNFYLGAGGVGKKLESKNNTPNNADIAWKKYARSEKELLLRDVYFGSLEENTGKEWFWTWSDTSSTVSVNPNDFQNSVRNLEGLLGDSIYIGVSFLPKRFTSASSIVSPSDSSQSWKEKMVGTNSFNIHFQNKQLQTSNIKDSIFGGTYVFASNGAAAVNNYKLDILPSKGDRNRFDGLSIAYKYNPLSSKGDEWLFPGTASGPVKIPVPTAMEIVKTENFIPMEIIAAENGYAYDAIQTGMDVKYFLQKKNSYKKPAFIELIPKRINAVSKPLDVPANTEYLILTSEILQSQAAKLSEFRNSQDVPKSLNTAVVLVEDIYRLYSAHSSPVAIRDYLRYAKERCQNLSYVLLAGSGTYDYRNMRQRNAKANLIPPYEAEDTASDDFFAILDSGEAIRFGKYELALAVGRLPVSDASEFENYIQKAMEHERVSAMDNGIWRNTIIFTADDAMQGQRNDPIPGHTNQMESVAKMVDTLSRKNNFAMELRKISLLQYENNGSGKKPEAARELQLRLNQGALFTYFYGHGNEVQWADEDLLNVNSLSGLFNERRYTILGSFSCQVARFDDAATKGLSEAFVIAKSKGAIAAIGALRESSSGYNKNLSQEILREALFSTNISLGEAFMKAKRGIGLSYSSGRYNNEKYVLLGEPVLSMPKQEIALNLNMPDTIQALQKLKVSGKASAKEGSVRIQFLEGDRQRSLSQNRENGEVYRDSIKVQGITIYNEELKISNGEFQTEFITPRKLSLGDTSAQIRLWAHKPGTLGIGRIVLGGISLYGTSAYADSINDNTPPSIKIYPCMRNKEITAPFAENARISLAIPACLDVVIEDSTGIDYREEADEGISFEVVGKIPPWHPWPFSEQTGKRAAISMNFEDSYDPGEYIFRVYAQDVLGNAASRSMRISLDKESKGGLMDVFNIPNPMKRNGTTFYFKDLSGDRHSSISIKIFDQNGKLVKTINNAVSGITHWDGRDSRGRLLANGLYHYVVQNTVSSLNEGEGKKIFEKKQKLLISR
ncbi:MAG: C25 family cysteine peptidase [Fibromonadaceae bacterium]|jgi:hypothetical protein|nr:C25 family cysteine peptidase [Fibromonadaceae bacterium]